MVVEEDEENELVDDEEDDVVVVNGGIVLLVLVTVVPELPPSPTLRQRTPTQLVVGVAEVELVIIELGWVPVGGGVKVDKLPPVLLVKSDVLPMPKLRQRAPEQLVVVGALEAPGVDKILLLLPVLPPTPGKLALTLRHKTPTQLEAEGCGDEEGTLEVPGDILGVPPFPMTEVIEGADIAGVLVWV